LKNYFIFKRSLNFNRSRIDYSTYSKFRNSNSNVSNLINSNSLNFYKNYFLNRRFFSLYSNDNIIYENIMKILYFDNSKIEIQKNIEKYLILQTK